MWNSKPKSRGCGCVRRGRGCSPKIAIGLCHGAGGGWHPCVSERIAGKRLVREWLRELRAIDPDDVDL